MPASSQTWTMKITNNIMWFSYYYNIKAQAVKLTRNIHHCTHQISPNSDIQENLNSSKFWRKAKFPLSLIFSERPKKRSMHGQKNYRSFFGLVYFSLKDSVLINIWPCNRVHPSAFWLIFIWFSYFFQSIFLKGCDKYIKSNIFQVYHYIS